MGHVNRRVQSNKHNTFHVVATFILTLLDPWLQGFGGYVLGAVWEVGDYYKPHYTTMPEGTGWFKRNFVYSDGFALEDLLVWNAIGLCVGLVVRGLLYQFGMYWN